MRPLPALLVGLALGSGIAWTARQVTGPATPHASGLPAPRSSPLAPSSDPAVPSLVLPPRLSATEADAALDAYLALPPFTDPADSAERAARAARLQALLTILPTESFPRLFATLATRAGKAEGGLRRRAFKVWVERDPAAVARWAAALVPSPALDAYTREDYLEKATDAWADQDLGAAYAWASSLPDSELRIELGKHLLARIASTDPTRALSLAEAGGADFQAATRMAIFEVWAKTDPAAAINRLGPALSPSDTRTWEFHQAFLAWAKRDPGATIDWISARHATDSGDLTVSLDTLTNDIDGDSNYARALAEALKARPELPNSGHSLTMLLIRWSQKDSNAALAWIQTVPDTDQRSGYLLNALNNGSGKTLDARLALARALPDGPARTEQIARAVAREADRDPDAALAWLQTQDDPSLAPAAAKVQAVLISKLAATDPSAALARWNELPADAAKLTTAQAIASTWAKHDPAAATRWLGEQLFSPSATTIASADSRYMLVGALSPWIRQDPLAAADWIGTLPDSPIRTESLRSFTPQYVNSKSERPANPAIAATFAQIQDAAVRDAVLSDHLRNWLRLDVHSATAWIESHDALSPEAAARLLP